MLIRGDFQVCTTSAAAVVGDGRVSLRSECASLLLKSGRTSDPRGLPALDGRFNDDESDFNRTGPIGIDSSTVVDEPPFRFSEAMSLCWWPIIGLQA